MWDCRNKDCVSTNLHFGNTEQKSDVRFYKHPALLLWKPNGVERGWGFQWKLSTMHKVWAILYRFRLNEYEVETTICLLKRIELFLTSEKFPSFENRINIVDDEGMCCSRCSFRTAWSADMNVTCLYVGKSHSRFITLITSVITHLASSTATDSFWAWTPRDSVFAKDSHGFQN